MAMVGLAQIRDRVIGGVDDAVIGARRLGGGEHFLKLGDVGAGRECRGCRPAQHEDLDRGAGGDRGGVLRDRRPHGAGQRVALVRPVQNQLRNRAVDRQIYRLLRHRIASCPGGLTFSVDRQALVAQDPVV
jgi:hypothetical protein